ncbi:MAG: hypothetical protein ABF247_03155 [Nonlabens sp.]
MYQDKSDHQLLELVSIHKKLTFQAQLYLKREIDKRQLDADFTNFHQTIEDKRSKINNLDYLENMGFQSLNSNDSIEITRTKSAVIMDVVAIVVGLLFVLIGVYAIVTLVDSFNSDEAFNIFELLLNVGLAYLGILGFQFLSGINRLIDHSGFKLLGLGQMITLRKRFDMTLSEVQKEPSSIHLHNSEEEITLQMDDVNIISTYSDNNIHKITLKKLKEKLQKVS